MGCGPNRMDSPLRVILANRGEGAFWSIEELFTVVAGAFPYWVKTVLTRAPCGRANLRSLCVNLRWARSLRGCDVVHQTGDIHYAVLGMWRCPVVLTIHDLRFIEEAHGLKRMLFWWGWLYLPCLRATRVTVISEFTKSRLLQVCRVDPSKVRVIPNCVSAEFVAQPKPWPASNDGHRPPLQSKVRVLVVGATPNKNLERVAAACAGLDVVLCILGCLSEVQRRVLERSRLEFEERSGLLRSEVVRLYQSCDLVCFVSTYEGFGMPILEGQAVGRPVLTSDISPMREVAGEGALKVDPFEVSAIREGLVRLLSEERLREELVKRGFENVKKYSAAAVAAQYADLYREVVEGK